MPFIKPLLNFVFYHNPEVVTKDISSTIKSQKDSTVSFTFLKNDDVT